jgi:hypothetical protein
MELNRMKDTKQIDLKENVIETTWDEAAKIRNTPKFVKTGKTIIVEVSPPPEYAPEVDGKFGKRPMYIVVTKEYGKIYVTPLKFMEIAEKFHGDFSKGGITCLT